MSDTYHCCGAPRSWSRNTHRPGCPYAVAESVKLHPAKGTHRLASVHAAETRRAGVHATPPRSPVIPLREPREDGGCPAHPSEPAFGCYPCAELGERE